MTMVLECPVCGSGLEHKTLGEFDSWVCPNGHGIGFTLSEAYGHLQDDEIHQLWTTARRATAGEHNSPVSGKPMVVVTVAVDADENPDAPRATGSVTIDVDVPNQFLWLKPGELEAFPADLPNPGATPEQLAREAEIMRDWNANLDNIDELREATSTTEQLYRRLLRHPVLAKAAGTVSKPLRIEAPAE